MKVLIINDSEVRRLLTMPECVAAMGETLRALAAGKAQLPLRTILWLPDKIGALGMMPAFLESPPLTGLKAVSYFPGNEGTELDSHQGAVLLFEAERGRLVAIVDATSITAIRTAAVSGAATQALANPKASELAILGSGVQAATHMEAMLAVRPVQRVRVWSKTSKQSEAFAKRQSELRGVPTLPFSSARKAVQNADLICTATSSKEPVLKGEWIAPGAHVNAVGSSVASARELDAHAVARSRLFVDRRESALKEAGDFVIGKQEGAFGDDHIRGEIGDVLLGRTAGRTSAEQITLFKSVGLAVEDLGAAHLVYREARRRGAGVQVELGGRRFEA